MSTELLALHAPSLVGFYTTFTGAVTLSSWIGKSDGIDIVDSIGCERVVMSAMKVRVIRQYDIEC